MQAVRVRGFAVGPVSTYRTGGHWRRTIVRVGTQRPDADGRRPDDFLICTVDSAATELAERICRLLNADEREPCPHGHPGGERCGPCAFDRAIPAADSCTCVYRPNGGLDPNCVVHHGRRARGPKPPPVGPGCICDGSGRTCPRHGVVL